MPSPLAAALRRAASWLDRQAEPDVPDAKGVQAEAERERAAAAGGAPPVPPAAPTSPSPSITYADHAGAALPDPAHLQATFASLLSSGTLHTNPHSQHAALGAGGAAAGAGDAVRAAVLRCLNAPPVYECVLTAGASAGLALVAASFPWGGGGSLLAHTRDNHSSVVGLREAALAAGAGVAVVEPTDQGGLTLVAGPYTRRTDSGAQASTIDAAPSLFAFPLESNFSGARYPPGLGGRVATTPGLEEGGGARTRAWFTLCDAAKATASGAPPDLAAADAAGTPLDFVPLSFYKLFGAPTGAGALVCSPRGLAALQGGRRYWGGGTLAAVSATEDFATLRPGPAGLEDGTPDFLGAVVAAAGWAAWERAGGCGAVAAAAHLPAARLAAGLATLSRADGRRAVVVYGAWPGAAVAADEEEGGGGGDRPPWAVGGPPRGAVGQGPIVAFNVLSPHDGSAISYRTVERLAALHGVLLRGGALCNPGGAEAALGLGPADARAAAAAGRACWDGGPAAAGGGPAGVVRASFGASSTLDDADAVLAVVRRYFVSSGGGGGLEQPAASALLPRPVPVPAPPPSTAPPPTRVATIEALWVYPLKGAAGFAPPGGAWPLASRAAGSGGGGGGLAFDRAWAAVGRVDGGGRARPLGGRSAPRLASITARLDLGVGGSATLVLSCRGMESSLRVSAADPAAGGAPAAAWLSAALGQPCRLARAAAGGGEQGSAAAAAAAATFANEADLLVLSRPSLAGLAGRLAVGGADPAAADAARFRPNLVLRGDDGGDGGGPPLAAHAEDGWARLWLGDGGPGCSPAFASAGPCARCGVVNLASPVAVPRPGREEDPASSPCARQPLLALAQYRRAEGGGILFGALFNREAGAEEEEEVQEVHVRVGMGVWGV